MTLRVLYLTPPSSEEGRLTADTFIDEEILALADRGVEILFITIAPVAEHQADPHPRIHARTLPPGKSISQIAKTLTFLWKVKKTIPRSLWRQPLLLLRTARIERFAADLIRQERIDIVHSNFGWPGGFGGVLAIQVAPAPLVTTLRGMDLILDRGIDYGLRRSRCYEEALRILLKNADCTIHVSEFMRQSAIALGAPEARAKTIRKGVDCDRFNGDVAERKSGATPVILTVASLIRRKGIHHVLEALSQLAASHDFLFVVVGEGSELGNLQALCNRLSLRERTRFDGYVSREDIPRWFSACDIFVLGSIWEASGNALLEAMASGRPVISTDSGGPAEYVDDGVTGFVVPVGSPEAMAAKIRILLDEPHLRCELGRNGRQRALARFSYPRMINDILDVYQDMTAG